MHRLKVIVGPLFVIGAYLMGSVCFGELYARRAGVSLRDVGSGNVGATNAGRALGRSAYRQVLLLDAAKGLLPTAIASFVMGSTGAWTAATGLAALVGHLYPLFFRFRGGKGAATGAGVLLGMIPAAGATAFLGFIVAKAVSRRASVGSLVGAVSGAGVTWALDHGGWPSVMASVMVALIAWRHRDNIARLARGSEPPG